MPSVCAANNCANRSGKTTGISYFRFPLKKKELLSRWVANMRRDKWQPTQYSYICSFHFEDKYMYSTNEKSRLLANAVPTIFTFPDHLQKTTIVERQPRKQLVSEESASLSNEPGERVNQNDHTDHEALQKRTEKLRKQAKHARQNVSRKKKQIVTYKTVVVGLNKRLKDCSSGVIGCEKNSDILKHFLQCKTNVKFLNILKK
ncbi:THAP domain-containing protein 5-like [Schistocerca piceifrons]|uniref:THAP domain-containing protein 5-like n=1 Tax=Schistocerca piceifrons TaxID=274613 RepID=UPI001F5F5A07|nr:THAP domain-containing protein 5-like [Schistocerca piceifrons]